MSINKVEEKKFKIDRNEEIELMWLTLTLFEQSFDDNDDDELDQQWPME